MTISFPLTFPTTGIREIVFTPRKVVGVNTAPDSLVAQTYEWPGERWEAQVTPPPLARQDGEAFAAFLVSLRGPVGSVLLGDPAGATPLGSASATPGTPQVDGAHSARSRTLALKTGLGTVANYLRAGSWLSLGTGSSRRLHKILVDVSLDSSGKATLDIWPSLRSAVSNNAPVYLSSTTGKFMLNTSAPQYTIDVGSMFRFGAISFVEDLRS